MTKDQALADLSLACRNARLGYDWIDPRIEAIRESFAALEARVAAAEADARRYRFICTKSEVLEAIELAIGCGETETPAALDAAIDAALAQGAGHG